MGGGNFAGSYGPIDASLIPELGANRFAFAPASGLTIEYSNDGGATWLDYGATDDQKKTFLAAINCGFVIGKTKSSTPANDMLRMTFNTKGISCYTILNKFCLYITTNGSQGCYCTIQKALESTPTVYTDVATKVPISGWSGYNIINVPGIVTYGNTPTTQYGRIRFIFGCTKHDGSTYGGLSISKLLAFGGVGWSTPSTMASNGHLYYWNYKQGAIFPSTVAANGGFIGDIQGNASTASNAGKVNGHTVETNVPSNAAFTDEKVKQTSTTTSGYTNYRPLIIGDSNSGTKGFTPSTVTAGTLTFNNMYVQPSTGTIFATNFDGKINGHTIEIDVKKDAKLTDTVYTLPASSSSALGGIKIGYQSTGRNYAVQLDTTTKQAYVYVPWTDTNTDTNTHYTTHLYVGSSGTASNSDTTNGKTYIKLYDDSTARESHLIQGSGGTTVTSDANGNITITSEKDEPIVIDDKVLAALFG